MFTFHRKAYFKKFKVKPSRLNWSITAKVTQWLAAACLVVDRRLSLRHSTVCAYRMRVSHPANLYGRDHVTVFIQLDENTGKIT